MENLSKFYIQKAKVELREDETRKEQSIKQFCEWLSKHPFITKYDMENIQILATLRAKKYQMDKVFESFNKTLIFHKAHPELTDFTNLDKFLETYDKGPCLMMKERDNEGRRILIFRYKILEENNICFEFGINLCFLLICAAFYEAETQIAGVIFIIDCSDVSMKYFSALPLDIVIKLMPTISFTPIRLKQINIVGLPAIANSAFELVKSFTSEKMKKRLNLCKNVEDLGAVMDVKNLTVEYGGTEDVEDCLKSYRKNIEKTALHSMKFFDKLHVDEEKMRNYENEKSLEGVGSFRKLEID